MVGNASSDAGAYRLERGWLVASCILVMACSDGRTPMPGAVMDEPPAPAPLTSTCGDGAIWDHAALSDVAVWAIETTWSASELVVDDYEVLVDRSAGGIGLPHPLRLSAPPSESRARPAFAGVVAREVASEASNTAYVVFLVGDARHVELVRSGSDVGVVADEGSARVETIASFREQDTILEHVRARGDAATMGALCGALPTSGIFRARTLSGPDLRAVAASAMHGGTLGSGCMIELDSRLFRDVSLLGLRVMNTHTAGDFWCDGGNSAVLVASCLRGWAVRAECS